MQTNTTTQYRVTVSGRQDLRTSYPADWPNIAEQCDERGYTAILERRQVFPDLSIFEMLVNPAGWIRLGKRAVSPWQVLARIH